MKTIAILILFVFCFEYNAYSQKNNSTEKRFSKIDWTDWNSDTLGCKGQRMKYKSKLIKLFKKPVNIKYVIQYMGTPQNIDTIYGKEKNNALYYYIKYSISCSGYGSEFRYHPVSILFDNNGESIRLEIGFP